MPASYDHDEAAVEAILGLLHTRLGADFRQYRPDMIRRRIRNRMTSAGVRCFPGYMSLLTASEPEADLLVEGITIKVSRFFRNPAAFDLLREQVLPAFAARGRPLRVWCAGCAYGEEAYSLAMLMVEAGIPGTVHATDIDKSALGKAAAGLYPGAALDRLSPARLSRHFVRAGRDAWQVRDQLRARVVFMHHNVTAAPPAPAPFDLISCCNLLIYFTRALQDKVFRQLLEALCDDGALVIGEAEWPSSSVPGELEVLSRPARVFRRPLVTADA